MFRLGVRHGHDFPPRPAVGPPAVLEVWDNVTVARVDRLRGLGLRVCRVSLQGVTRWVYVRLNCPSVTGEIEHWARRSRIEGQGPRRGSRRRGRRQAPEERMRLTRETLGGHGLAVDSGRGPAGADRLRRVGRGGTRATRPTGSRPPPTGSLEDLAAEVKSSLDVQTDADEIRQAICKNTDGKFICPSRPSPPTAASVNGSTTRRTGGLPRRREVVAVADQKVVRRCAVRSAVTWRSGPTAASIPTAADRTYGTHAEGRWRDLPPPCTCFADSSVKRLLPSAKGLLPALLTGVDAVGDLARQATGGDADEVVVVGRRLVELLREAVHRIHVLHHAVLEDRRRDLVDQAHRQLRDRLEAVPAGSAARRIGEGHVRAVVGAVDPGRPSSSGRRTCGPRCCPAGRSGTASSAGPCSRSRCSSSARWRSPDRWWWSWRHR